MYKFSEAFEFQKKSKIKAGDGQKSGQFPFYTSSAELSKYIDNALFDGESLVFGTGGNASVHFADGKFSVSTDCLVAQPKTNDINAKFVYHYLFGNIRILEEGFKGAGLKHISKSYISDIDLPKIPRSRQDKIVSVLDSADNLRQKRKEQLALLDDYLKSVFFDMFGDPLSNNKNITTKKIGELGEVITGNTPSRQKKEYYGEHIEWIKSDNINTPEFILTKSEEYLSEAGAKVGRLSPVGSVLVTCIAGSPDCIGNCAITDREVAFNQQINAFVPSDGITTEFFFSQIHICKKLIQKASTESMKGMVSKGRFSEISILAPSMEEQRKFSMMFREVANTKQKMRVSLGEMDNHFNALMQRYFG